MKYTNDKSAQILLSLLKSHGIKKIIASPGTTNIAIVGSMQYDSYFEIYSAVDERSAGYMACGLASESGEPVALVCTGATASRNYYPAVTEAYYRKLPILVIAGSHGEQNIGHLHSQVIDRSCSPKDTVRFSAFVNPSISKEKEWENIVIINKALIELTRHGGGPVLINIESPASKGFDTKELPVVRRIGFYEKGLDFPSMPNGLTAIFVGSHKQMSMELVEVIDSFCATHNAVVFCDHTSGYHGKYQVKFALVCSQPYYDSELIRPDILIHIGEVSGDTYTTKKLKPKKVWRVSPDGELRDLFKALDYVFEIDEYTFFSKYVNGNCSDDSYYWKCQNVLGKAYKNMPKLKFGNLYIANRISLKIPHGSVIHFGIFNTLRSWNFFHLDNSIVSCCNVGGFGIDGALSTLIGSSFANREALHFLIVGDLAFFYDLNSLGNRHLGNNVRILLINNGRGIEFRKKDHPGYRFGKEADQYIAAAGHFGCMSHSLVKHYAEDLGFFYYSVTNEKEFELVLDKFLNPLPQEKPIVLEAFTGVEDEVNNLDAIRHIFKDNRPVVDKISDSAKARVKGFINKIK